MVWRLVTTARSSAAASTGSPAASNASGDAQLWPSDASPFGLGLVEGRQCRGDVTVQGSRDPDVEQRVRCIDGATLAQVVIADPLQILDRLLDLTELEMQQRSVVLEAGGPVVVMVAPEHG